MRVAELRNRTGVAAFDPLADRLPTSSADAAAERLGVCIGSVHELIKGGALSTSANTPIGTNSQAASVKAARSPVANACRHLNSWLAFRSCRSKTTDTEAPGTNVSATIPRFSPFGHDRRRCRRSPTPHLFDGVHLALVDTIDPTNHTVSADQAADR